MSRLGFSGIKHADLTLIITKVFDEEYDPANIQRRVQARQSRKTFNFSDEDLGMMTDCPNRIFEVLESFVASVRKHDSVNGSWRSTPDQLKRVATRQSQ